MAKVKVSVEQWEGAEPVPEKVIAQSIVAISDGVKKLFTSGMNERAIVILLHDSSGVGRPDIRRVLRALTTLKEDFMLIEPKGVAR